MDELTWEGIKEKEVGFIFHDETKNGMRFIVVRGTSALCAYIGIPKNHPLSGLHYDDIPLRCHGGLTFSGKGDELRPKGFYWYGWDYGHCDDYAFYFDELSSRRLLTSMLHNKKWLVKDVIDDSWCALYEFEKLMKLSEKIINQTKEVTNGTKVK